MKEFEPLIGEWHGEGEMPIEPPMKISVEATIERLGEFIVFRSVGEPADVPDSISIIGGAPEGEPQPMHYFDARGVERLYLTTLEGSTWTIWRAPGEDWNGPHGPGFNQRFIGEISADGNDDRRPLGARHGRRRRRVGARLPAHLRPQVARDPQATHGSRDVDGAGTVVCGPPKIRHAPPSSRPRVAIGAHAGPTPDRSRRPARRGDGRRAPGRGGARELGRPVIPRGSCWIARSGREHPSDARPSRHGPAAGGLVRALPVVESGSDAPRPFLARYQESLSAIRPRRARLIDVAFDEIQVPPSARAVDQ